MTNYLPVAVDVMGGDYGPRPIVRGAIRAVKNFQIPCTLVGRKEEIIPILKKHRQFSNPLISVVNANGVITMEDTPSKVIRSKTDTSLSVAFNLVKEGRCSAVVSSGNTGAMMAAGLFVSKTMPGVMRPAIATLIPKIGDHKPTVLLDSGANIDCRSEQLVQFAIMGESYARSALGIEKPRVALLSNGTEASKGTADIRFAAQMLDKIDNINFAGYCEGRDIPKDLFDVVVCDGFIGNIVLKSMEGTVRLVFDSLKFYAKKSFTGKIGLYLAKPVLQRLFAKKLNPSAYGGAPLLGLNHVAIVCHGSSNAYAISNAISVAKKLVNDDLISLMSQSLEEIESNYEANFEGEIWNRVTKRN